MVPSYFEGDVRFARATEAARMGVTAILSRREPTPVDL